jgi:hypothetical protein
MWAMQGIQNSHNGLIFGDLETILPIIEAYAAKIPEKNAK